MELLKFTLSGKTAFFKKPEVNTYLYFTYGQIHKVALFGLFGAIMGYKGYGQMQPEDRYPEFYERLKTIRLSVVPGNDRGLIPKKIQSFNNSVGYASYEQGGNLIVREQWLEYPEWDVYLKIDSEESKRLADEILGRRAVYIPYLGKNDHLADLDRMEIAEGCVSTKSVPVIHSLVPSGRIKLDVFASQGQQEGRVFKYEEYLPVGLNEITNLYEVQQFVYSNMQVLDVGCEVVQVGARNLVFY